MTDRERSVSKEQLEKMDEKQLQQVEDKLGGKIRDLLDSTVGKINKLLDIYGLQMKVQFLIEEKPDQ